MKRRSKITAIVLAAVMLLGSFFAVAGAQGIDQTRQLGTVFPSWFSYPRDTFKMRNQAYRVAQRYYTDLYGDVKGVVLSDYYEMDGAHGLCYGLSLANACLLNNRSATSSFVSPTGTVYGTVNKLPVGGFSNELQMSLLSFIKYCDVTQFSGSVSANYKNHRNDAAGLRAAVRDFVYNNGPAVVVGLLGGPGDHEVLAVGLTGDEDIVILDSNDPEQLFVMDLNGKNWSYRFKGYSWSSPNDSFDFDTNASSAYRMIADNTSGREYASPYAYTAMEEASGATDIYVKSMARLDEDKLLTLHSGDLTCSQPDNLLYIDSEISNLFNDGVTYEYSWLAADKTAVMSNTSGKRCSIGALGNLSGVLSSVPRNATVTVTKDHNEPVLQIDAAPGESAWLVSLTPDGAGALARCVIEGSASDGRVYAAQTDAGMEITGVSNAVIRLTANNAAPVTCRENAFLVSVSASGSSFTVTAKGDADGDGSVSPGDARLVLRLSVGLEQSELFSHYACDYDGDGKFSPADARLILRHAVGLKDEPMG